jgi:hypothetical protein
VEKDREDVKEEEKHVEKLEEEELLKDVNSIKIS